MGGSLLVFTTILFLGSSEENIASKLTFVLLGVMSVTYILDRRVLNLRFVEVVLVLFYSCEQKLCLVLDFKCHFR